MPDLRKLKTRGRRGRVPRPVQPSGIQLRYFAALKEMLAYAHRLVHERIVGRLPDLLGRAAEARGDSVHLDADPARRINKLVDQAAEAFYRRYPHERLQALSDGIARATSEHQKAQLFRQVKAAVGVDLSAIATPALGARIKQFTAENVALIKSVPQSFFSDVEKTILAGMRAGTRAEDLASEIENDRLGVAESRAKLIARDQVLKFNGELNEVRQQALGVERYIWRSVEDERVRPEHEDFDGNTYSWDDPPGDGSAEEGTHPGTAINCRCFAEGVFDDILDAIDAA